MRRWTAPRTSALALAAAVALTGCGALDGDLASGDVPRPGSGVAASALDGDVRVTTDQLAAASALVAEVDQRQLVTEVPPSRSVPLQREVLSVLVQRGVLEAAARDDLGVEPPSEADVEAEYERRVEEAGGEEQFAALAAAQQSSAAIQRWLLPNVLLTQVIADELAAREGGDPAELFGQWSQQVLAEAEPRVARRFGAWDATAGRIVSADAVTTGGSTDT